MASAQNLRKTGTLRLQDSGRATTPKGGRFATASAVSVLVGHGGVTGAIVEVSTALVVVGVLVWAWLRERRRGDEPGVEKHRRDGDRGG